MHAVASLLHSLPLQSEESDRGDLMEAKSQLFLKYFTLFMNLLNDCNYPSPTTSSEDKESATGIRKIHQPNMSSLRNATIQAMSNLLSANIGKCKIRTKKCKKIREITFRKKNLQKSAI